MVKSYSYLLHRIFNAKMAVVLLTSVSFVAVQANPLSYLRSRVFSKAPMNRQLAQYCADKNPNLQLIKKMIIDDKVDPNGEPLCRAVDSGIPKTVDLLLQHGSTPYPSYFSDKGPVRLAVELNKHEHLDAFRKHGTSFYRNTWPEPLSSKLTRMSIFAGVNVAYWGVSLSLCIMAGIGGQTPDTIATADKVVNALQLSVPVFAYISYKVQQRLAVKNDSLLALAAKGGHRETIHQILNGLSDELLNNASNKEGLSMLDTFIDEAVLVAKDGSTRDILTNAQKRFNDPEALC